MPLTIFLVSLVIAVLAELFLRKKEKYSWRWDWWRILALVLTTGLAFGLALRFGEKSEPQAVPTGLVIGVLVSVLASLRRSGIESPIPVIALGIAGAASVHLVGTPVQTMTGVGLVFGTGLGALVLGGESCSIAAFVTTVVFTADHLSGRHFSNEVAPFLGCLISLFAVLGALVTLWLPKKLRAVRSLAGAIVAMAASVIFTKSIDDSHILLVLGVGFGAGVAIDWLLPELDSNAVRLGIAAIISLGVATVSYSLGHAAGMALALVASAGVLAAVGNARALLAIGPLLALVLYRLMTDLEPTSSHSLDIGQHYAMIGLCVGIVLPLIAFDWLRQQGFRAAIGAFLWALIIFGIPPLVFLMFGVTGVTGFVVGLGFACLLQGLRLPQIPSEGLLSVGLIGSVFCATTLSMLWMDSLADMARGDKIKIFEYSCGGLILASLLIVALTRRQTSTPSVPEAQVA